MGFLGTLGALCFWSAYVDLFCSRNFILDIGSIEILLLALGGPVRESMTFLQ